MAKNGVLEHCLINSIIRLKRLIEIVCGPSKAHGPINIAVVKRDPKMKCPRSGQQEATTQKINAQIVGLGPFSRSEFRTKTKSKWAELMG